MKMKKKPISAQSPPLGGLFVWLSLLEPTINIYNYL